MKNRQSKHKLPLLAFGESTAVTSHSVADLQERVKQVGTNLLVEGDLADYPKFEYRSALANVNGLKLVALASSPHRYEITRTDGVTLVVPFVGRSKLEVNGQVIEWQGSDIALLLPGQACAGVSSINSVLLIGIDVGRLRRTAHAILDEPGGGLTARTPEPLAGAPCDAAFDTATDTTSDNTSDNTSDTASARPAFGLSEIDLSQVRKVSLHSQRLSFEKVLRHLCGMVDLLLEYPDLLDKSGIEESFYRIMALMLQPALCSPQLELTDTRQYARRKLDRLCHYIQAHIDQVFTLGDLDRVSGMSRRSMHYAFQLRYQCTPMQWVRAERLIQAHQKLCSATPAVTVTSVALLCGYNSSATFANYYKKQYGELPSATLARALRR